MRWIAIGCAVALGLLFSGCDRGSNSSPPAVAGGGAGAPPPPGGGPAPPPTSPDASAPPGASAAPADGYAPPGDEAPQLAGAPGGGNRRSNRNRPAPGNDGALDGGTPDGVTPDGATPDGTPPGEVTGGPEGERTARLPPRPKTLREQAIDALRAGNEDEGLHLLYTHFAIMPEAGAELAQKMAWVPGLRRPALGARIGIAVRYLDPPPDFEGSPQPIGSSELLTAMGGFKKDSGDHRIGGPSAQGTSQVVGQKNRIARMKKMGGGGPPEYPPSGEGAAGNPRARRPGPGEDGEDQLVFYTGDFGMTFLEALVRRVKSGEYGTIYNELVKEIAARPARRSDPNNPEGAPDGVAGQFPGSADGDPGIPGGPGPGGRGGAGRRGGGRGPGAAGGARPGAAQGEQEDFSLAVVWLGKADSKDEITKLAQEAKVDLLATYEIVVSPSKVNSFVNNKTTLRITTVGKKEEPIFKSAQLENRIVMQERDKDKKQKSDKSDDPVDKEVSRAMEALDKVCKVEPLPAGVTADAIKRRIAALIAEKPANPLPAVVEARYYLAKGLLRDDEFSAAALALLGEAEYARLITKASTAGVGPMLGGALSLPGLMEAVHGLNSVVAPASRAAAKTGKRAPGDAEKGDPARSSGLKNLLPFGGFGGGEKKQ